MELWTAMTTKRFYILVSERLIKWWSVAQKMPTKIMGIEGFIDTIDTCSTGYGSLAIITCMGRTALRSCLGHIKETVGTQ